MNNCKHAGTLDSTFGICHCDINHIADIAAEKIRKSYMNQFDRDFVIHNPACIFELENCIEKCPYYEVYFP